MGNVRGVDLLDARSFVRESYGPDAETKALAALAPNVPPVFLGTIRELGWYPLEALEAYLVAAKAALAPSSPDFFRRQGRFGASHRKAKQQ
jgi:hypothetical protein